MNKTAGTAVWLVTSLGFGAVTGAGILSVVNHKTVQTVATAWPGASPGSASKPSSQGSVTGAASSSPSVASGVRSDGTHFGSIIDFLLPMPVGYDPGPDDSDLGNNASITAAQLDSQVGGLFPKLQQSDLTSAKGAMEAAHMKDGAVRTYQNSSGSADVDVEMMVLQLDPSMAAKSTSDFLRIVTLSSFYRTGPAVAGYPNAKCVLPATRPGDKLDQMICLGTVGDTFVVEVADGPVPMDQKPLTGLFAQQLDLLKKGLGK